MLHRRAHPGHDCNDLHQRQRPIQALMKQVGLRAPVRPAQDWAVVLRRPVHLADGQSQAGYTDAFELICCACGDNPDLDYRHAGPGFQQIRGPYTIAAGIAAYANHGRYHGQPATGPGNW